MARRWYDTLIPWRSSVSSEDLISGADSRPSKKGKPRVHEQETGVSGTDTFGGVIRHEDANAEWDNFQKSVKLCEKMRRTDAQIRAMLQVIKLPLLAATWEATGPDDGDAKDQEIADFINKALFDDDAMDDSWDYTLRHILTQLDFGFSVLESIWRVDEDKYYRIKRLAPRIARTVHYWYIARDGQLLAIQQYAPVNDAKVEEVPNGASDQSALIRASSGGGYKYITIPADYLVVFTHEKEGDQFEGTSLLRTVWRNFYFKDHSYRLEGIRLDRFGVGIPMAEVQEGYSLTDTEHEAVTDVLKKVRANERAFLVAPASIRYRIIPEGSTSSSGSSGAIGWIEHHDQQIARNILAGFLTMGSDAHGTLGFGSKLTDLFTSNLRGIANGVAGELKRQVVRKLCDLNFDMKGRQYPSVVVKDLDLSHIDSLVNVLAQLTGTVLTADDDTEAMLRKILKLPPLDESLTRKAQQEKADAAAKEQADQAQKMAEDAAKAGLPPPKPAAPAKPAAATTFGKAKPQPAKAKPAPKPKPKPEA